MSLRQFNIHLFPGQGFQKVGMTSKYLSTPFLKDYYDRFVSSVPGLQKLMEEGPQTDLDQTQNTQPAILLHSILAYKSINRDSHNNNDIYIGHSVGEFSALVAAGHLDLQAALNLVQQRGKLMQQYSEGMQTGMLVVRSSNLEMINSLLENNLSPKLEVIAIYNSDDQTVLSGRKANLQQIQKKLKTEHQISSLFLPVSSAFHNPMLSPAKNQFNRYLEQAFSNPQDQIRNVLSNNDTEAFGNRDETIRKLCDQLDHPVMFKQSIRRILEQEASFTFIEYGAGVLIPIVKNLAATRKCEYVQI